MRQSLIFFLSLLLVTPVSAFFKPDLTVKEIKRLSPSSPSTNASTVTFRVKFSEKVNGVDLSDFILTTVSGHVTGIVSGISTKGNNSQYDVTVTSISNSGTIRLDLRNSGTGIESDKDGDAIVGGFTTGESYNVSPADITAPSVLGIARQEPLGVNTTNTSVTLSVNFSEFVTGVDAGDFSLNKTGSANGSISNVSGSGSSYSVTINSISGTGSLRLDLNGTGTNIIDASNNAIAGGFTTGESYNVSPADATAPSVSSITRQNPSDQDVTINTVTWAVSFSESVTDVDVSDFSLTATGSASGTIFNVSGSGSSYSVTVNSISGTGSIRLDLKTSTNIIDGSNNPATGAFTSGQTYNVSPESTPYGFTSVTPLSLVEIGGSDTQFSPQGKTWYYAGKWWAVMPNGGVSKIYRLDGSTWTETSTIFSSGGRADCWVDGNLVHILIHRNTLQSPLISLQYNAGTNSYIPWVERPSFAFFSFPAGSETATLTVDGSGRMWVASADVADVQVWYSDGNYSSWSGPITIATGILDDDICAITKLPGKIGVLFSNQSTGLFGFKTHVDGTDPAAWSADEMPAAQSAIPGNPKMADDHINMVVTNDGTLYCAAKTSYNSGTLPLVVLLVRRPSGTWDRLYTIATGSEDGTRPIVIVNEDIGKVKVIYTTVTNGGDIVYKESLTSNISFGVETVLIGGGGALYNFATSTHQTYNSDVVILATKIATVREVVSVLASDGPLSITRALSSLGTHESVPPLIQQPIFKVFPTVVKRGMRIIVQSAFSESVGVIVRDPQGRAVLLGRASAGMSYIDTRTMSSGIYYITVNDKGKMKTIKIMVID